MSNANIRIRVNRSTGDLEIEGSAELVNEWWDKLWPTLSENTLTAPLSAKQFRGVVSSHSEIPDIFGEFLHEFRSDITDVDRVLIAAAFVQAKEAERTFTTKTANQILLDQNIKVANASECVRRLLITKRAFVVSDGKFRVSSTGFEHIDSLKHGSVEK